MFYLFLLQNLCFYTHVKGSREDERHAGNGSPACRESKASCGQRRSPGPREEGRPRAVQR
jgi:hypothetical protein